MGVRVERQLHDQIADRAPYLFVKRAAETWQAEGCESYAFGDSQDGHYVRWSWDGEKALVRNDRYGFSPVFYSATPERFIVSDSIPKLLALGADSEPDDEALNVFLHIGWFLGEETPFKAIRSLPPGASLSWTAGRLDISSEPVPYQPASISRDEAIDGYIELFRQAIARRLPDTETFGLPISGGRDSRHILLELMRQGRKPTGVVTTEFYPPRRNTDTMPARALAAHCGVPHTVLRQSPRFAAEAETILRTSFCADEHSWMMGVCRWMGDHLETTYDGIIGDVLTQSPFLRWDWLDRYEQGRWQELLDSMLDYYERLGGFVVMLNERERARFPASRARERILAELRKYADHDDPINKFVCWSRSKREVALMPFSMFAAYTKVETPYLDRDLFDFLYNLPVAKWYREGGNRNHFHSDVIVRAFPEAAHIPYSDDNWTRRRIVSRHHWLYALQLSRYLASVPHSFLDARKARPMLATSMLTGTRIASHYGPMMQYLAHLNEWSGRKVFG